MKVRFINYRKTFPMASKSLWRDWLKIERRWMGKIIAITVRHYGLIIDFRKNWILDMFNEAKEQK